MAILVTGAPASSASIWSKRCSPAATALWSQATDHCPRWRSLSSRVCRGLLILVTGYVRAACLVADAVRCQAIERIVQGTAVTADRQREASSPAASVSI